MKDLLTVSRMGSLLACPRKHYWRYECGMQQERTGDALRFGSAWHRAMEARWQKKDIEDAFNAAIADKTDLDELQLATLSGMLAGYYTRYADEPIKSVHPEIEFRTALAGSKTFDVAGKIDGLAVLQDSRTGLVEHKTAGCDIAPDSDYWLRLRGNGQVMQYILAARQLGWDVATVIYDVARKPMISRKEFIPAVDSAGLKIVKDATGARVLKKDGSPKQTPDKEKGETLEGAPETCEQFGDRLAADTKERPDFYFARREVPILEDDLAEFEIQRLVMARQILSCRSESRRAKKPEHGWPRNVGEMTCKYCEYSGFCLQNTCIDLAHPPAGFRVGDAHPELSAIAAK
jgi:hypothetical protein